MALTLPLVPWEGGSAYWAQFSRAFAAGWANPSFFPISVFLGKTDSGHPAALAALGINTLMGAEHQPPISQATSSLFVIAQSPASHTGEWTQAEIGDDPKVVGWFIADECEQGEGQCAVFSTDAERLAAFQGWTTDTRAFNDGRFMFANFGNGVLNTFWAVGTMDQWMATVDGCGVDKYAYTSPGVRFEIERSPDWPLGDTPANNSKVGAAYGWLADQLHGFDTANPTRRPLWVVIETKMPFLAESPRGIILYDEIEGAVWNAIVHEARGICYFQHNGFYDTAGFPAIDPNTGVAPDQDVYSLIDCEIGLRTAVTAINSEIAAQAPVLNTQSYVWDFGATGIDTMLKWKDNYSYIFAVVAPGGATGSKTFTLHSEVTGATVEVLNESRTLPVTGGQFTDTFANEFTHHIYKVESVTEASTVLGGGFGAFAALAFGEAMMALGQVLSAVTLFSATGTMATARTRTIPRTTAINAVGTMATARTRTIHRSTLFDATATLSSIGLRDLSRAAAFNAAGTMGTAASVSSLFPRAAAFEATAQMASIATRTAARATAFGAVATMATEADVSIERATAFDATGTMGSVASHTIPRATLFDGVGTMDARATRQLPRAAAFAATGTMSVERTAFWQRTTLFSATSICGCSAGVGTAHVLGGGFGAFAELAFGEAELPSEGALKQRLTAFGAVGSMSAVGDIPGFFQRTTLFAAVAAMATARTVAKLRSTAFSATGTMASTAKLPIMRSTAFSATGAMASIASARVLNARTSFVQRSEMVTRATHVIPFYRRPVGRHLWDDYGRRASQIRYRGGRF